MLKPITSSFRSSSDGDDRVSFNTIDTEIMRSTKLRRGAAAASFGGSEGEDEDGESEKRMKHVASLKAGRTLCKMRSSSSLVATGGKENDLQIWDLNRIGKLNELIFKLST